MMPIQEPFTIDYGGVTTTITPIVNGTDMRYSVDLPHRNVIIEPMYDENEISYWVELGRGRTDVAEELGYIIEERDM